MDMETRGTTPKDTPLPPLTASDPLTGDQWRTLLAIADTIIPCIVPASIASASSDVLTIPDNTYSTAISTLHGNIPSSEPHASNLAKSYLAERPSQNPLFILALRRLFTLDVNPTARKNLLFILTTLNTPAGSLLLTGGLTPFHARTLPARESILQSWSKSRLGTLRQLQRILANLIKSRWAQTSPTLGRILGFPRVPVHLKTGTSHPFTFIQFPPSDMPDPEVLSVDVVIVGSGCGGAVAAKNLAEAGLRVVVVEKAYHWPAEHLPMSEAEAGGHLFMEGGFMASDDGSVNVTAASAFGGGGTVNWSASLQTQGKVREEWSKEHGLPLFTSGAFQESLDRVCQRMGVGTEAVTHNKTNSVLLDGARRLGWSAKAVPQNTGGKRHYCGYCTLGCGNCEKQGPMVSWLPDAERKGAVFVEGCEVREVMWEMRGGKKVATGVRGVWVSRDEHGGVLGTDRTRREVTFNARSVIVACGSMQSPLLLLNSGLKSPHIGRNLHIHPVAFLGSVYPEEVQPWEGGILTAVVNEYENLDGHWHGVKLEAMTMLPSWWLPTLHWSSGLEYKSLVPKMRNMVGHIALARDKGSGRVYSDPDDGRCRYDYTVSKLDKQHILEGLLALAKINFVEGATEIFTSIPGAPRYVRSQAGALMSPQMESSGSSVTAGTNEPSFQTFLVSLKAYGLPAPETFFASAHQMGTCRMSSHPSRGVVDPNCRVWEAEGLYVMDASVFPSASGVNPMITNMAIADWASRALAVALSRGTMSPGISTMLEAHAKL